MVLLIDSKLHTYNNHMNEIHMFSGEQYHMNEIHV